MHADAATKMNSSTLQHNETGFGSKLLESSSPCPSSLILLEKDILPKTTNVHLNIETTPEKRTLEKPDSFSFRESDRKEIEAENHPNESETESEDDDATPETSKLSGQRQYQNKKFMSWSVHTPTEA